MGVDTTCRFRLMRHNLYDLTYISRTTSSENSSFPYTNAFTDFRSQVYRSNGSFRIASSNQVIYFNDGSDKSANIAISDYTSGAALATAVQTALNSVGSGFTVAYSTTTYKFTISNASAFVLKLSSTTNAIWNALGWVSVSDTASATSHSSDQGQIHYPNERFFIDFGYHANCDFWSIIGDLSKDFGISNSATITVNANNVNDFTSPPLSKTMTITDDGAFLFIDDVDSTYRYWEVLVDDKFNQNGYIEFGYLYGGEYEKLSVRNISTNFTHQVQDNSIISESESGVRYADTRTKNTVFGGLAVGFVQPDDKQIFEDAFNALGRTTPFFFSLDPTQKISNSIQDFTKYVYFDSLTYRHVVHDYYQISFGLREVI